MKIVFFGSSEFAVDSLKMLTDSGHDILAVVTQPDRKKGRHLKVTATPVKNFAESKNIKVFQPEKVSDPASIKYLKSLKSDLFIVVAFGEILTKDVLEIPKIYPINLHASLLPGYRGAAPINWAIVKGEKKTGLSVIRMNEKMDAGDIILQRGVNIEDTDTSESLGKRLSELGAILLIDAIRLIELDKTSFKKQTKKSSNLAPRLKKEDGLIDWKKTARDINNMIRGLVPWPCAFTILDGKILKIWKSEILPSQQQNEPGRIIDVQKDFFMVGCGKGILVVKELQLESGKRMDVASFMRGHKLETGTYLGETPPPPTPNEPVSQGNG